MQQALPYRNWLTTAGTGTSAGGSAGIDNSNDATRIKELVSENAVIVFARRGCCMCHVVKLLLQGHGVNPTIFDVDDRNEAAVFEELIKITEDKTRGIQFPAVFVGGKLFGGLEKVMATHITGELVPILREARALWL